MRHVSCSGLHADQSLTNLGGTNDQISLWGDTVITEAGGTDKVAALVFVAAFAPNAGESTSDLG